MSVDATGGLSGRTAVVTGAGRGIGQAIAIALARAWVEHLVLIARTADQLEASARLVHDAGARPHVLPADLIDVAQIEDLLPEVDRTVGHVDILINNAGMVAPLGPTLAQSAVSMLDAFRLNTLAPALLASGLLPGMLENGWGRIVNVSSGVVANPAAMIGGSTYAATKAALEAQTFSMAAEYATSGVTINVYRPGGVDTAMQEWIRNQDPDRIGHALHDRFVDNHASGKLFTPEASAAALLAHLSREETGRIWDVTDPT